LRPWVIGRFEDFRDLQAGDECVVAGFRTKVLPAASASDFLGGQQEREIKRGDAGDDAQRSAHAHREHAGAVRGHCLADDAPAFAGGTAQ
jgi:hypothetical protein